MLSNMFDPATEREPAWDQEIRWIFRLKLMKAS